MIWSSSILPSSEDAADHKCIGGGVGSSSSGPCCLRHLVPGGRKPPYQSSGDGCCSKVSINFLRRFMSHTMGWMSNIILVVAYIYKQGGTVSPSLYLLARQILVWSKSSAMTIALWGTPVIDLFGSALNKKLPAYCSFIPDPVAWQEDVFLVL